MQGTTHIAHTLRRTLATLLSVGVFLSLLPLVAGFESHVINVTATIKGRNCAPLGFEKDAEGSPIQPGQVIDNEYASFGLTVSADNAFPGMADLAVAFDSTNPIGTALDLGTPNVDFGGLGVGAGGALGGVGENFRKHNNLLIIPRNFVDTDPADGNADDPEPESVGGIFTFTFEAPTAVHSIDFIDVDEGGGVANFYDGTGFLIEMVPLSILGDNSYGHLDFTFNNVKKIDIVVQGTVGIDNLCFVPVEEPSMCDARSKGYWANHEGCDKGDGTSDHAAEVQTLSSTFSGVFGATSGSVMCELLWTPNCPSGNTKAAAECRAKGHLLADELNVVTGKLDLDALIAGADDGSNAFDALGLSPLSTVEEALAAVESIITNPSSTRGRLLRAGHVAARIYTFYEKENPFAPKCIFDPDDVPECGCPDCGGDVDIDIHNEATVINSVFEESDTGDNSGGDITTGDATSTIDILNIINQTIVDIGCCFGSSTQRRIHGEATTTSSSEDSDTFVTTIDTTSTEEIIEEPPPEDPMPPVEETTTSPPEEPATE